MVETFGMGILLAAIYVRTGSLITTIFAHFLIDFPILYLSQISTGFASTANMSGNVSVVGSIIVAIVYALVGIVVIRSKIADNKLPAITHTIENLPN